MPIVLTKRESQVLLLRWMGVPMKQVAARLGIAVSTAKTHLARIFLKCGGVQSSLEAIHTLTPTVCRRCPRGLAAQLAHR